MKSLNIKKAAAVAAGTALLVGAALAALPGKDFYWDASGNTNVQIVVGGDAQIADGVAAAKLAAVIGSKAYTETGGAVTPDATGTVKLSIVGTSSTPTEGTYMDAQETDTTIDRTIKALTLGEAHGMAKGTFTYMNTEYDYKESVEVQNTVKLKYEEDKDYHGVYFETTGGKTVYYKFDFIKNLPYGDSKKNQTIEIPFLGTTYVVNKNTVNEIHLVQGEKVSLGIGQSADVTIAEKTYTVTLDSASLDETTSPPTGYATITVSGGDLTSPVSVQLDTGNNQDATMSGFYSYLQSVQKSYTPGQGGSATLRVGGEMLKLIDNDKFPGSDIWKVDIVNEGGANTDYIMIYLNKNYAKSNQMQEIVGPTGYFTIAYAGTDASRGDIEKDKLTVHGTESNTNYIIDEFSYNDQYENSYTVEMWDDSDYRNKAFLAYNASAYIATVGTFNNISAIGYAPLKAGDTFFVMEQPIEIDTVYYKVTDAGDSYVTLNGVKYSFTSPTAVAAADRKGDTEAAINGTAGPYYLGYNNATADQTTIIYTKTISIGTNQGSQPVSFAITSGDFMDYTTDDVIYVTAGADYNVRSDYYNMSWIPAVYDIAATGYTTQNNTMFNITHTVTGDTGYFQYLKSGDYEGMKYVDGVVGDLVNKAVDKASEDRYVYHEVSYGSFEATDSNTAEAWLFADDAKLRVTLTPGVSETTAMGASAFTIDTTKTFPYDVTSDVAVVDLTCDVDSVATGVTFGTVSSNLVVSDSTSPTGNAIVIGGHYVNKLAVGKTEALTAAGAKMTELDGSTLYAAGYTAADTAAAVDELITSIKAL